MPVVHASSPKIGQSFPEPTEPSPGRGVFKTILRAATAVAAATVPGVAPIVNAVVGATSRLSSLHERKLTESRKAPIFITNYPREIKAFYMKVNPDKPDTVICGDLLAPEGYGEIIGGSVREEKNELLIERLQKEGANLKNYEWFVSKKLSQLLIKPSQLMPSVSK
jgi:hypothetical protein